MRILHVTKKYPNALGGDAIDVLNLEIQQSRHGHKVFILTTNCNEIINKKNLTKFGLKDTPSNLDKLTFRRILSLVQLYFKSFKLLREIKPDVVHSHSVDMGYIMSFACRKYGVPIINHFHSGFFFNKKEDFTRFIIMRIVLRLSKFQGVITINENDFIENKGKFHKLFFIPNGIDLKDFNLYRNTIKKKNTVLFVGRVEEYKGLKYLLESIKLIKEEVSDIKLIVVGKGDYLNQFESLSKQLGLQKNIIYKGQLPHKSLESYYRKSSVLVLPSYTSSESFGNVLLESLYCGTPVITTNIVGLSSIIKKNKCGIVIKTKDSKVIAKSTLKLLSNYKLSKQMSENGKKLVEKNYTWEKIAKDIENVYRGVLIK